MTDLRREARGRDCTVRLPGCPNDTETTVLAHYPLAGISGARFKSPDLMGAFCDYYCHSRLDGAVKCDHSKEALRHAHAEGVFRTQYQLIREDKIRW